MRQGCVVIAILLVFAVTPTALANTMEVDVRPGQTFNLETEVIHDHTDIRLVGSFGLDQTDLLSISYTVDREVVCFGGRHEIKKGVAFFYDYSMWDDANQWRLGFREITDLVDELKLIGELKYTYLRDNSSETNRLGTTSTIAYTVQFRERISREWSGNIDFTYSYSEGESDFSGAFGADLYLNKAKLYFNYRIEESNADNTLLAGIEVSF